jgi:hypothetical protein
MAYKKLEDRAHTGTVSLPNWMWQALRRMAVETDQSLSALVQSILIDALPPRGK